MVAAWYCPLVCSEVRLCAMESSMPVDLEDSDVVLQQGVLEGMSVMELRSLVKRCGMSYHNAAHAKKTKVELVRALMVYYNIAGVQLPSAHGVGVMALVPADRQFDRSELAKMSCDQMRRLASKHCTKSGFDKQMKKYG